MKVVGYIAVFVFGVVTCYLLVSLGVVDAIDGVPGTQAVPILALPTYMSFVGVMMTSVTAVLAAVAIGIGVVAAYTFREIKTEARRIADEAAQTRADEALSEEAISDRIDKVAYGDLRRRSLDELEPDFDPTDQGER